MYKLGYCFSDWIIIWFILYKLEIVKFNPKIFIIFGIIENVICYICLFSFTDNFQYYLKKFYFKLIIHSCIKLIMLFLLIDTTFESTDFFAGLILYFIYNIYIKLIYDQSIYDYYNKKLEHCLSITKNNTE